MPTPLTEWAAVKNGLSQQQTNFEDPLLTTSCAFEDLFQQGSRPASEIAYSRSDYDGWKWWTTWHQCQKDTPVLEVAREIDAIPTAGVSEFGHPDTVLPRVRPAHQRAHRIQFVFGNCSLLYLAAADYQASRL